ncbi:MAG TPA: UDP-N-acetylmuramate--L-alanine ligase [Acidimicrobiales bacterium]|nr:MAG: UDP-N-acetylmuramate--L-alanine ligase [Actinobacteria bacterium 21-73-9]HQU27256.1 UDP-N-acetylmuramate--L-alanine ligase [Acidimicrobiales bacterium]
MSLLEPGRRVHVMGVGGAGMSGLALWLAERGARVSGCDVASSPVLDELAARRIAVLVGHDASHLAGVDSVVWSPAVARDSPELVAAAALGLELVDRPAALAQVTGATPTWGVAGTHGKTTATSMLVQVALAAGRDAGWLLGAPVLGVGANGHYGADGLVLEVDESYGTMAGVVPEALAVTNVEPDHLDHYGTLERLESAFADLVARVTGPVVAWADDPGAARALAHAARPTTVGAAPGREWRVEEVTLSRDGSRFALLGPGERLEVDLRVTGRHNVANAAVVAVLARTLGVEARAVERGLSNFLGAPRRFQRRGAWRGVDVVEDYAHLPGEIAATLAAAAELGYVRVGVVFQPHRVTRTLALLESFAPAFAGATLVIVTDLFRAGEPNPEGVTGERVATALAARGVVERVRYVPDLDSVPGALSESLDGLDLVLVLGAGDVGHVIGELPGGLA